MTFGSSSCVFRKIKGLRNRDSTVDVKRKQRLKNCKCHDILLNPGVPAAATIEHLPSDKTGDTITLKWSEPQNNGRVITQHTVYQRIVTDGKPGEWKKLRTITDTSVRELTVELERGKVYEFAVTATNQLGESLKEDGKIMRVKVSGSKFTSILILE